jgi:hypothetical protein
MGATFFDTGVEGLRLHVRVGIMQEDTRTTVFLSNNRSDSVTIFDDRTIASYVNGRMKCDLAPNPQ